MVDGNIVSAVADSGEDSGEDEGAFVSAFAAVVAADYQNSVDYYTVAASEVGLLFAYVASWSAAVHVKWIAFVVDA